MSQTNHNPQFSTALLLLRRAVTCMTVVLMVITCAVLTAPVEALALQTSPSALSFTGTQGGADPAAQSVTIWKRGERTRSWTASVSDSWLTVSPMSGSISSERDQVSVDVNLSSLPAGNHSSNVIIFDVGPNGGTRRTVLPVSLTVLPSQSTSSFNVSPSSLVFSGTGGGASPAAQTFAVSNTGSGTLSWAASDSAGWLVLSPMSGTNNGSVTANVNMTGLAAGTYNTAISVTAPGATTKTISVSLTLTAAALPPAIGLNQTNLSFSGTVGGTNPSAQTIAVSNVGGGTLSWAASDNAAWLALSPISGTNNGAMTANVNLTGLAAGTYNTAITVTAPGATTKTVPVSLTVTAATPTPSIGLGTTSLGFAGTVGGTNPSAQTIAVSNVGGGTLSWTASENAAWLALSPTSGTNSGIVTASVNLTGLAAGTHNATVTVSASGIPAKTLPVTLSITASTASATIGFSPTSLTFTGTVGGTNPAAKPISISNTGGGTLSWTASENAAWLTLSPVSGTNSGTVTASVNMTGLAAGTYNGIITIAASGSTNSPRQIPVSLTLNASTAGTATLTWNASTESDLTGYKVYRGTGSGTYGAPIATLPKTTTNYAATGLQNGTTYFFVITAYDSAGNESLYSNEVSKSIF